MQSPIRCPPMGGKYFRVLLSTAAGRMALLSTQLVRPTRISRQEIQREGDLFKASHHLSVAEYFILKISKCNIVSAGLDHKFNI